MPADARAPCALRSGQFRLFVLELAEHDAGATQAWLAEQLDETPDLLSGAGLVVVPATSDPAEADADFLPDLFDRLRFLGFAALGVVADDDSPWRPLLKRLGLAAVRPEWRPTRSTASTQRRTGETAALPPTPAAAPIADAPGIAMVAAPAETEQTRVPAPAPAAPAPNPAPTPAAPAAFPSTAAALVPPGRLPPQVHEGMVRSGQRLYARDRDLIVLGAVSNGAEVIADGNLYVFGRLLGRALAGARGDHSAQILCTQFGPELVSVAGIYKVLEAIPADLAGRSARVALEGEALVLSRVG